VSCDEIFWTAKQGTLKRYQGLKPTEHGNLKRHLIPKRLAATSEARLINAAAIK